MLAQLRPRGATKLAKVGAWLQLAPVLGVLGAVWSLKAAFAELGKSGASDVGALSARIGELLVLVTPTFLLGAAGCVMLGAAVFVQRRQAGWVKALFCLSCLPTLIAAWVLFALMTEMSSKA
jgi:hypothetical protein